MFDLDRGLDAWHFLLLFCISVHVLPSRFFKIHFNFILPQLDPSSGLFPSVFFTKTLYVSVFSPVCPAQPILLELITLIIFWGGTKVVFFLFGDFQMPGFYMPTFR